MAERYWVLAGPHAGQLVEDFAGGLLCLSLPDAEWETGALPTQRYRLATMACHGRQGSTDYRFWLPDGTEPDAALIMAALLRLLEVSRG